MHYLKCSHCAGYSALKSEYITFCDHCSKKFPLTFAGWKAQNPEGSFDQFTAAVGCTEEQYHATIRKQRSWGTRLRPKAALITTAVILVTCSALGAWYGPGLVKMFRKPAASPALLETANWRTFRGNVLRLQTPFSLSPSPLKNRHNVRFKAFNGGGAADGLEISMLEAVFLADNHIDLEPASRLAADELSRQTGISQFSYNEKKIQLNGQPAIRQQGSYVQDHAAPMEFSSLVVVKGGTRVQLLVTHQVNDSTARKIAEAVLGSAQLN